MNLEKGLGLRVQNFRKKAGFTQQELCQKSGLSYSTLAKIERGAIKSPSIFTIQQIANVLGIGIDELMGAKPVKNIQTIDKKTSKSGVKFVYFDMNGCLVSFFHGAFTKIATDLDLPLDHVETTCWHYNDAVCRGDISLEEYNRFLAQAFNQPSFDWASYYLSNVTPIAEAHELAKWAAKYYKVGLLTNVMPGLISSMRAKGLIPEIDYDVIIDSSEVKAIKPEPEIFDIATTQAGVAPEEILFIDDSRANLMVAEKIGWKVSWFDDFRPKESSDRVRQALEFA